MNLESGASNPSKPKTKGRFTAIRLPRAIILVAILFLLGISLYVAWAFATGCHAVVACLYLVWFGSCSCVIVAGVIFINLTGEAQIEPNGLKPSTPVLLGNLYTVVLLTAICFGISLPTWY